MLIWHIHAPDLLNVVGLSSGLNACCQQLVAFPWVPSGKISWVSIQNFLKEDDW